MESDGILTAMILPMSSVRKFELIGFHRPGCRSAALSDPFKMCKTEDEVVECQRAKSIAFGVGSCAKMKGYVCSKNQGPSFLV